MVYYYGKRNSANMNKVAHETSSGTFVANSSVVQSTVPELPFGGVGESGYGRCHGIQGFQQFSNMKSYFVKPALNCKPFTAMYPPHTPAEQAQAVKYIHHMRTTQARCCKCFWFWIVLLALCILAIIFRQDISDLFTKEFQSASSSDEINKSSTSTSLIALPSTNLMHDDTQANYQQLLANSEIIMKQWQKQLDQNQQQLQMLLEAKEKLE